MTLTPVGRQGLGKGPLAVRQSGQAGAGNRRMIGVVVVGGRSGSRVRSAPITAAGRRGPAQNTG
jgi:hypothetical protein